MVVCGSKDSQQYIGSTMGLSLFDTMFHMGWAFVIDIGHMHVQKRRLLGAWMANTHLILIVLVPSASLLSVCLKKIDGLASRSSSSLMVLYISIISHHCLLGIGNLQEVLIFPLVEIFSQTHSWLKGFQFFLWIGEKSIVHSTLVPSQC